MLFWVVDRQEWFSTSCFAAFIMGLKAKSSSADHTETAIEDYAKNFDERWLTPFKLGIIIGGSGNAPIGSGSSKAIKNCHTN